MNSVEPVSILLISIIGLVIWAVVLSNIIGGATKSKKIERHLRIQNALLANMLLKQGLSEAEVKTILDQK